MEGGSHDETRQQKDIRYPMTKRHYISIIAIAALGIHLSYSAAAGDTSAGSTLTVDVVGVKGTKGKVCVALYNDADGFPGADKHYRGGWG